MQSGQTKYGTGMTVSACLWLGLFPLIQLGSFHTITGDKWLCMLILTGVTGICFAADVLARRVSTPRLLPLLLGGGLLLWTGVSCLFSPWPGAPWWIGTGRRDGLASQLCYLCLFFLFSFSKVRRRPVLISAGCGVLVFFAVVLLQRAGGNPFGLYPEDSGYAAASHFQGTIGNVDICSGYLVIVCGLFLSAFTDAVRGLFRSAAAVRADRDAREKRRTAGAVAAVAFLFLVLSVSVWLLFTMEVDSGILALAVLLLWTFVRLVPKRYRLAVLILLLAAMLLIVWYWPGERGPVRELSEILHGKPQESFGSGRVGIWIRTLSMLLEEGRLLTGTGPDTFAMRFSIYLNRYELTHPEEELLSDYYDSPHSEYLAMVVNCGIPALLCFLALILAGCFGARAWQGGVLGYGVQALFSFSVCIVAPMFWVVLGLSLAIPWRKPGET